MASYRYGYKTNILGEWWYAIEKRFLFIWIEAYTPYTEEEMMDIVKQLKNNGNIVFKEGC